MDPVDSMRQRGRLGAWFSSRRNPIRVALLLVAIVVLGFQLYREYDGADAGPEAAADTLMPVANPPLEPDRPDLIGEPRIEDE